MKRNFSCDIIQIMGGKHSKRAKYSRNGMGLWTTDLDFRTRFLDEKPAKRPSGHRDNLYVDTTFSRKISNIKGNKVVEWKRPQEFLKDPKLFQDGATCSDVKQGEAETCYFLSMLAGIADKKEIIRQLLPESAYTIEKPRKYDGVFHARFFQFGKWVDVYTDDYLPVVYGDQLWGAKSPDENKLWVALTEKAFARLHGSYDNICGGNSGYACLLLTGGIDECIELSKQKGADKTQALFDRIKNALHSGCQIACSVPDTYHNHMGLVGDHRYSLVDAQEEKASKTKLFKLRNPWGQKEWSGAWCNGSSEWSTIHQNSVTPARKEDGEFYISLSDFIKYFSDITICSLTPDFNEDGRSGSLKDAQQKLLNSKVRRINLTPCNVGMYSYFATDYVRNIYGEWNGESAAGFLSLMQNPRFSFTVTKKGIVNNDFIPLVVQIMQHSRTDITYVRCDVFKVLKDKINQTGRTIAVEMMGEQNNVYTKAHRMTFRYKLKPGHYIIVPSTKEKSEERAFLLRLFTSAPLKDVKELPINVGVMSCKNENTINVKGKSCTLIFENTLFGEFITGQNAGGQVSNRTSYHLNPQYVITIPNTGSEIPLLVHIMQTQVEPQYPVGIRIFQLDNVKPPVDYDYLIEHYNNSPANMDGLHYKFITSWDVDSKYLLKPGKYLALVHLDKPNTEKAFCIVFKSTVHIDIVGFQTG